MSHEEDLKYFKTYSQINCYVNKIITKVADTCGCVGQYRGESGLYQEHFYLLGKKGNLSFCHPEDLHNVLNV